MTWFSGKPKAQTSRRLRLRLAANRGFVGIIARPHICATSRSADRWAALPYCFDPMQTMIATDTPTAERLSDLVETLRAADGFDAVLDALRAGQSGTVDGAWGSSAGLTVASLGADAPATVLVVLAHPGDIEAWGDELTG